MQLLSISSAAGRRAATGTVLALAAATLSLGVADSASAVQSIELQGTVTGAGGAPLAGVLVTAHDATTGAQINVANVVTNASGHYQFDDDSVVGSVKLRFNPDNSPAQPVTMNSPLPYQVRWSGGSRYEQGATVTSTSVDPATAPVVNGSLPQYAAVTGNVRVGADGHIANDGFGAWANDADENYAVWDDFADATTGNYRTIVTPNSPVRIAGFGSDTSTDYLVLYWQNADTLAAATPVNIAPGQTISGINFRLTNVLTARQAPSIAGYPTVGLPLTASSGTWSRSAGTEFSYAWLRNGTLVGTGATYVPTAADYHQRLSLVVTALNGEFKGQSTTMTSDVVKYGASERVHAHARHGRMVTFAVKLVSAKQSPVKGKVVVMRGTHRVHTAVRLRHGKAFIMLKHQPKGRQTFTVHYKGDKVLAPVDKLVTVRVHN
jgi:carboxypeptidase family protein